MGFVWTLGGVGSLTNYLWSWMTLTLMNENFLIMNIIMTSLAVISTLVLAGLVWRWQREGHQYFKMTELDLELEEDASLPLSNTRTSVELGTVLGSGATHNTSSESDSELPADE